MERAASTYSASRSASTWPRMSRAVVIQPSATSATTTGITPLPVARTITMAPTIAGNARKMSITREITESQAPPLKPASAPSVSPSTRENSTVDTPTIMASRVP